MAEKEKRMEWVEEIKKKALQSGWSAKAVALTDWESFYDDYGVNGLSPSQALEEDLTNA